MSGDRAVPERGARRGWAANKRAVTLDLSLPEGGEGLRRLAAYADVVIETMQRITGFGRFGPHAQRRGFGTLAESVSGWAAMAGDPEGPPMQPPFGLADGIAGVAGAHAVMVAVTADGDDQAVAHAVGEAHLVRGVVGPLESEPEALAVARETIELVAHESPPDKGNVPPLNIYVRSRSMSATPRTDLVRPASPAPQRPQQRG